MIALPAFLLLLVFILLLFFVIFAVGKRLFFIILLLVFLGGVFWLGNYLFNLTMSYDPAYFIPAESSYYDFKLMTSAQDYGRNGKEWIYAQDSEYYYTVICPDQCSVDDGYYFIRREEAAACEGFSVIDASTWCVFESGGM